MAPPATFVESMALQEVMISSPPDIKPTSSNINDAAPTGGRRVFKSTVCFNRSPPNPLFWKNPPCRYSCGQQSLASVSPKPNKKEKELRWGVFLGKHERELRGRSGQYH
ncbi:hypothetical protein TWF225_010354 [Orbilia oligospora]|nr:hypothetical protein TWF225_010354 [Orbilia oligospora]KAF3243697.1 hypothetical protein TWF128_009902 [Orbilia oligospora]KAF3250476.1 hypothetical protein TWF217_008524 [Orbilia oligospora]KAF3294828.1 hypothetical protein TWF132_002756 [Orbilia oligospora]